jgi:hypothetical protein
MDENKRRRSRVEAQFDAFVLLGDEKIPVHTQNISMKGCFARTIPVEGRGGMRASVCPDQGDPFPDRRSRRAQSGIGYGHRLSEHGRNAFFHLRNIVRYSSEDADRIDRELETPAFP